MNICLTAECFWVQISHCPPSPTLLISFTRRLEIDQWYKFECDCFFLSKCAPRSTEPLHIRVALQILAFDLNCGNLWVRHGSESVAFLASNVSPEVVFDFISSCEVLDAWVALSVCALAKCQTGNRLLLRQRRHPVSVLSGGRTRDNVLVGPVELHWLMSTKEITTTTPWLTAESNAIPEKKINKGPFFFFFSFLNRLYLLSAGEVPRNKNQLCTVHKTSKLNTQKKTSGGNAFSLSASFS